MVCPLILNMVVTTDRCCGSTVSPLELSGRCHKNSQKPAEEQQQMTSWARYWIGVETLEDQHLQRMDRPEKTPRSRWDLSECWIKEETCVRTEQGRVSTWECRKRKDTFNTVLFRVLGRKPDGLAFWEKQAKTTCSRSWNWDLWS